MGDYSVWGRACVRLYLINLLPCFYFLFYVFFIFIIYLYLKLSQYVKPDTIKPRGNQEHPPAR